MQVNFTIYGEPKGKGRPRTRVVGGKFAQVYTDKETKSYENLVRFSYLEENTHKFLNDEELKMKVEIYQSIPKSTSKKKTQEMLSHKIRPTKKPDIDNILKAVLDGLNTVAFKDDTQVVEIQAVKYFSDVPRVYVEIENLRKEEQNGI